MGGEHSIKDPVPLFPHIASEIEGFFQLQLYKINSIISFLIELTLAIFISMLK